MRPSDFEMFSSENDEHKNAAAALEPPRRIARDLVSSQARLILSYSLAGTLGYLSSLLICAQCSIGFTPLSWQTMALLHKIPDPWCPLVCGAIFGIFPFLFSLLFLNRFQHRYLLYRLPWVPIGLPLIGSSVLTLFGSVHDLQWHLLWFAAALSTPYLGELFLGLFLRQKRASSSEGAL